MVFAPFFFYVVKCSVESMFCPFGTFLVVQWRMVTTCNNIMIWCGPLTSDDGLPHSMYLIKGNKSKI